MNHLCVMRGSALFLAPRAGRHAALNLDLAVCRGFALALFPDPGRCAARPGALGDWTILVQEVSPQRKCGQAWFHRGWVRVQHRADGVLDYAVWQLGAGLAQGAWVGSDLQAQPPQLRRHEAAHAPVVEPGLVRQRLVFPLVPPRLPVAVPRPAIPVWSRPDQPWLCSHHFLTGDRVCAVRSARVSQRLALTQAQFGGFQSLRQPGYFPSPRPDLPPRLLRPPAQLPLHADRVLVARQVARSPCPGLRAVVPGLRVVQPQLLLH